MLILVRCCCDLTFDASSILRRAMVSKASFARGSVQSYTILQQTDDKAHMFECRCPSYILCKLHSRYFMQCKSIVSCHCQMFIELVSYLLVVNPLYSVVIKIKQAVFTLAKTMPQLFQNNPKSLFHTFSSEAPKPCLILHGLARLKSRAPAIRTMCVPELTEIPIILSNLL